jgi:hypothetical protein
MSLASAFDKILYFIDSAVLIDFVRGGGRSGASIIAEFVPVLH